MLKIRYKRNNFYIDIRPEPVSGSFCQFIPFYLRFIFYGLLRLPDDDNLLFVSLLSSLQLSTREFPVNVLAVSYR